MRGEISETAPDNLEVAYPVVTGAFIGKTLVIVAAAIHGRVAFSASQTPGMKSFNVPEPAIALVETSVIEDGSRGTHDLTPLYARIEEWAARKGVELLPVEPHQDRPPPAA
jgi:hypothetical protein